LELQYGEGAIIGITEIVNAKIKNLNKSEQIITYLFIALPKLTKVSKKKSVESETH